MIKRNYSGNQRQACNVIWNAAGRYDYDPPFMAFRTNGTPDFYFNMIIGFVEKYFDSGRVEAFLESYRQDRRADEFDDLLHSEKSAEKNSSGTRRTCRNSR